MELEVAEQCLSYLANVRGYEKLPHSIMSMNEIRNTYSKMRGRVSPIVNDPTLISGVLQCALKDMTPCLLSCIYEDLLFFDTLDDKDGMHKLIAYIRNTLSRLPQKNFMLLLRLCEVLCRSAQNASCGQLAANMAPYICRPPKGAFMSIRHMDDLRRLRPGIQFLLENYTEIFDKLSCTEQLMGAHMNTLHIQMPNATTMPSPNTISKKSTEFSIVGDIGYERPRSSSGDFTQRNHRINDQDSIEWRILEALVSAKVKSFLNVAVVSVIYPTTHAEDAVKEKSISYPIIAESKEEPVETSSSKVAVTDRKPKHSNSLAVMTERRLVIAECKAIKSRITKYESDFMDEHSRLPKDSERGGMDSVYKAYRSMKRGIRHDAAVDIQRYFRGYINRKQLLLVHTQEVDSMPMETAFGSEQDVLSTGGSDSEEERQHKRAKDTDNHSIDSDNYSDDEIVGGERTSIGSLASGMSGVGFHTTDAISISGRYKELVGLKRDMKNKLKLFDDEFFKIRGIAPSKKDKEVMRPYYEQYHEVKSELKKLTDCASLNESESVNLLSSKSEPKLEMDESRKLDIGSSHKRPASSSSSRITSDVKCQDDSRLRLSEEKKQLHLLLKNYEKGFTKTHGRPVMHADDIVPVAEQYKRYKELKKIFKSSDSDDL